MLAGNVPLRIMTVLCQVGPGLVYLKFNHSFLGQGVMMHCVTPVEPLLQCVTHTMFYQASIPPVVPNFILKVESIQVPSSILVENSNTLIIAQSSSSSYAASNRLILPRRLHQK